jgi:ABC-2 type transport system ATP-binding protein
MQSSTSKPVEGMCLEIHNLGKQYRKDFWGLREFTLSLGPGIYGLLGPNGAGKSTLMRMLATITRPTEGKILWNGADAGKSPDLLRNVLGYLPQDFGVYPNLTAFEFLEYIAAIKGLNAKQTRRRIDDLLQTVNLVDTAHQPLGGYSGGMKQRIGIAQALLNDPRLLIVDEPTVGLDPEERVRFRSLLADLAGERIILLSTHIVSDVESAASEIILVNKGRLIERASPETLMKPLEGWVWEWLVSSEALPVLKQRYQVTGTTRHDGGMLVRVISERQPEADCRPVSPTLEDVYLYRVANHSGAAQ